MYKVSALAKTVSSVELREANTRCLIESAHVQA